MNYLILFFWLQIHSVSALPPAPLSPAQNFTGLTAHRFAKIKKYSDLAEALPLSQEDQTLLTEDLQKLKLLSSPLKLEIKGSLLKVTGSKTFEFDFSEIEKKVLKVNGRSVELSTERRGYRHHSLQLQRVGKLSVTVVPEIGALVASTQNDVELYGDFLNSPAPPALLLKAHYQIDENSLLRDLAKSQLDPNGEFSGEMVLALDEFQCADRTLKRLQTRAHELASNSSKRSFAYGPEITKRGNRYIGRMRTPLIDEERDELHFSLKLAEACCAIKGCPEEAAQLRKEAIQRVTLRAQLLSKETEP